jgi:1-acyl-sn-glycerol-3-phosphate acyltransferase
MLIYLKFLCSTLLFFIGSQLLTLFAFFPLPFRLRTGKRIREKVLMFFARFINSINYNVKIKRSGNSKEKFETPAIIISNHVSVIDIVLVIALTPRIVMITNPGVKNSKFEWLLRKFANLHLIEEELDKTVNYLRERMENGYSVLIFPEGVRSPDRIRRFHKGAFVFAELLNADILPLLIKAEGDFLRSKSFFRYPGLLSLEILERIKPENKEFGENFEERTKLICQYYRNLKDKDSDKTLIDN